MAEKRVMARLDGINSLCASGAPRSFALK